MKTTSYILLGLLGAGALLCASAVAVTYHFETDGVKAITFSEKPEARVLPETSRLILERHLDTDSTDIHLTNDFTITVTEDPAIKEPVLFAAPEWEGLYSITASGTDVTLDIDFHGIFERYPGVKLKENEKFYLQCEPSNMEIRVPSGMLHTISSSPSMHLIVKDFNTSSLLLDRMPDYVLENCRIDSLTIGTAEALDAGDGEAESFERIEMNACQFGHVSLNWATISLTVRGKGTTIDTFDYNELPYNEKKHRKNRPERDYGYTDQRSSVSSMDFSAITVNRFNGYPLGRHSVEVEFGTAFTATPVSR